MANIDLMPDEQLIKEGEVFLNSGGLFDRKGTGFLTNKRFVHHKIGFWSLFLLGIFAYLSKGSFNFQIELEKITAISKKKIGLGGKILSIETGGGKEYELIVSSFEEWFDAIKSTLLIHHKTKLIEGGEDRWVIQK